MPRADELEMALQTVQTVLEHVDGHCDEACAALVRKAMTAMKRARAFQRQEEAVLRSQTEAAIQAYAAFEAQGHQYQTLFTFAASPLLVTDASGGIRDANAAAAKLLDMPAALMIRQPLVRFVISDERRAFRRRLVQLNHYETTLAWIMHMRRADGTCFAAEVLASEDPAADAAAHPILWQFRELSDRSEAPHIESDRTQMLVDGVRDYALFLLDLDGRIASWNAGAEALFGYTAAEIVGKPFAELYVAEDRAHSLYQADILTATKAGPSRQERWHQRKDGRRVRCSCTVSALDGPGHSLRGFTVVMHDVTSNWRTNEILSAREEQLRLVLQATQMGHWDYDLQSGKVHLSPEFNRVMGLPTEMNETSVGNIQECVLPADREQALSIFDGSVSHHRDYEAEFRIRHPNREVRWISVTGHNYYDPLDRPVRSVGVARDITERKRAEEDVIRNRELLDQQERQAAILEERNRMAREIHDTLAQGFTGIFIQLEAAEDALATAPEEAPSHIARARDLALNSLAEARRSVHALRSQALEGRDLPAALHHLIEQMCDGDTEVTASLTVRGDPYPLGEAAELNLLRIGQEGLTNSLRHGRVSRVRITLTYRTGAVRLKIADNGVGFVVSEIRQDTGGAGGMGLLGIVERAQGMHGRAAITSQPGKGTIVDVTVPIRSGTEPSKSGRRT